MIEIDGSYREGGGQILRTASLLSCATGQGVHIFNVRKGRSNPGLRHQHLWGLRALADLYNAELKGADLGSMEVWFTPQKVGTIHELPLQVKIPTAGSITLVLQSLIIPASLFEKAVKIVFEGGATDTSFSPTINYYLYVLIPILRKMGYVLEINIGRRGYYPKGGARVDVTVYPNENSKSLKLAERGKLQRIFIFSYASKFLEGKRVAERQASSAENLIIQEICEAGLRIAKEIKYFNTMCPGSSIDIIAEYENSWLGANALGKLGKRAEKVGEEAAQILLEDIRSRGCLDRYMADQILPYVALVRESSNSTYWGSRVFTRPRTCFGASGLRLKSEFSVARVTEHCLTNMWVIEKFVDGKFQVDGNIILWE